MSRWREEAAALAFAWQFLTRVPLPVAVRYTPGRMAASQAWLPAVGLAIGAIAAAVLLTAALVLPAVPAVLLSIAATAALTGAFHEDGLADTFDGIGGGPDRSRRLEIMQDSRIGTYGAVGLGLALALKASALAGLDPTGAPGRAAAALVAGHALSRASALLVVMTSAYVRERGTGRFTAAGLGRRGAALVAAAGLVALAVLAVGFGPGGAAAGVAGLGIGHLLARRLFERQLGGYTGDCLGATQQLSEVGLYLGLLAWV